MIRFILLVLGVILLLPSEQYQAAPMQSTCWIQALVLDAGEIRNLALDAGFPPDVAMEMVRIAWRESNHRPGVLNANAATGDESYGLWQINMRGDLGRHRMRQFGIREKHELLDGRVNARAAYALWKLAGLEPWRGGRTE